MNASRAVLLHDRDLVERLRSERVIATTELETALAAVAEADPLTLLAVIADNGQDARDALVSAARRRWPNVPVLLVCRSRSAALDESACRLHAVKVVGDVDSAVVAVTLHIERAERRREAQRVVACVLAARHRLSKAEHDCVCLLAYGIPRAALPVHLGKAKRTVEAALASIFRKLDVRTTTEITQMLMHAAIDACLESDRGWLGGLRDHEPIVAGRHR